MKPTSILVTGSSGTVGTALVKRLLVEGRTVIPLDIRKSIWDERIDRKTLRHDLRKPLYRLKHRKTPDIIVHLAANARVHELVVRPELALDNYLMTHNVLEFARQQGIRRVIFSSSREIYGESRPDQKRREDSTDVIRIKSPYTASKFAAEALMHAYRHCYDMETVIVRLSNVYGRFDVSERVIPLFTYYALRNRDITVFGRDKKLDFTFIDDCIEGLVRLIDRFDSAAGKTFNLSRGRGERLIDLANSIVNLTGSYPRVSASEKRVGEVSSFVGDIAAARKSLSYNPRTNLAEGLALTLDWYKEAIKSRPAYDHQRRCLARWGWL